MMHFRFERYFRLTVRRGRHPGRHPASLGLAALVGVGLAASCGDGEPSNAVHETGRVGVSSARTALVTAPIDGGGDATAKIDGSASTANSSAAAAPVTEAVQQAGAPLSMQDFGDFTIPYTMPAEMIHVAAMPAGPGFYGSTNNGTILGVEGGEANCCYYFGTQGVKRYSATGWSTVSFTNNPYPYDANMPNPVLPNGRNADAFCSGHVHDQFGRFIIMGGLKGFNHFADGNFNGLGVPYSARYDPLNAGAGWTQLTNTPALYYPTLIKYACTDDTCGSGIYAFAGNQNEASLKGKIYGLGLTATSWTTTAYTHTTHATYPRVHVLPDWNMFIMSPKHDAPNQDKSFYWNPWQAPFVASSNIVPQDGGTPDPRDSIYYHFYGSSILLPLQPNGQGGYLAPRVLIAGGLTAHTITLNPPNTAPWTATGARPPETASQRRYTHNATLLPTGQVLITGGSDHEGGHVRKPEIFGVDLGVLGIQDTWFAATNDAIEDRDYHSVAILMPDGRVWIGGGNNDPGGSDCGFGDPFDVWAYDGTCNGFVDTRASYVEILTPWYARAGVARPAFNGACPATMNYYTNYTVNIANSEGLAIMKVGLLRAGSVTHSWDADQRLVWLPIVSKTSTTVTITSPYSRAAAPPGDYYLYVLKREGDQYSRHIPSKGCWTRMAY